MNRTAYEISTSEIPAPIAAAFAERSLINMPELARLLQMDTKTLRRHIAAGNLVGRIKGFGVKSPRRVFTISDVTRFLAKLAEPISTPTPISPSKHSKSAVAFPVRHLLRVNMQLPKPRKPKRAKAETSSTQS